MTFSLLTVLIAVVLGFSLGIMFYMVFKDHIVKELPSNDDRF